MHTADETLQLILSHCAPLPAAAIELNQALGRVLRRDATTDTDFPPFDRAAMDGFAIARNASVTTSTDETYTLVSSLAAGDSPAFTLKSGECASITTGAEIPVGATHVLPQENADVRDNLVRPTRPITQTHIRRRGEDARARDILISAGQPLTPAHLSILASIGITYPLVGRKPRLMHIVSGNELVHPSSTPVRGQVRDSNSSLIAALCTEAGAAVRNHIHAPDDEARTLELATSFPAITYDILLFSGGSGPGSFDFAKSVIEKLGYKLHIDGVNIRPGKPLLFGTRGNQLAFGLPGNPLSHFVIFHLFIRPVLLTLLGAKNYSRTLDGRLVKDLPEPPHSRLTYWPARWSVEHGQIQIEALPWRSSGHLSALAAANALLKVPADATPLSRGAEVSFLTI